MDFFKTEIDKTISDIASVREDGDLLFAMLSDTFASDESEATYANIRALDDKLNFDFVCHLGNFVGGNNPKRPTMDVLESEFTSCRNSVKSKKLFVTPGNCDGWRDERYLGQMIHGIITDEAWCSATSFIDECSGVHRPCGKPYYYVELGEYNTRLIFLNSYFSQHDEELEFYQKYTGFSADEVKWLKNTALKDTEGKKVVLFSHRIPLSRFETGKDPYVYKGNSTEPVLAILQQAVKGGTDILCHFGGAYDIDESFSLGGISHSVIASALPRGRELGTYEQDSWDAVLIKKNERKIYLFRFGAGEDRVIEY